MLIGSGSDSRNESPGFGEGWIFTIALVLVNEHLFNELGCPISDQYFVVGN
jgi:hypothetical protein